MSVSVGVSVHMQNMNIIQCKTNDDAITRRNVNVIDGIIEFLWETLVHPDLGQKCW